MSKCTHTFVKRVWQLYDRGTVLVRIRKSAGGVRMSPGAVVEALNLGDDLTFDDLLKIVEKAHGKPIEVKEIDNGMIPTVTGLWIETEKKSFILLPSKDRQLHRNHAACHEFGHILLGHETCGVAAGASAGSAGSSAGSQCSSSSAQSLMPPLFQHIGRNTGIKRMLARSLHWNEAERDAERVAYLLSKALLTHGPDTSSNFERTFI